MIYLYSYSKKCKFNIYDRRKRLRQGMTDMFLKFHYDLSEKESIYVSRGPRLEKFRDASSTSDLTIQDIILPVKEVVTSKSISGLCLEGILKSF